MSRKLTPIERILYLSTALLAAYQVAVGIEGLGNLETILYTIGFGVLLVASLLLMILGHDILGTPPVVLLATIIPLSISTGLVHQYASRFFYFYILFDMVGLSMIFLTRNWLPFRRSSQKKPGKAATTVLAIVHGISGLVIFFLPLSLTFNRTVPAGFVWVGMGGALFGLTGILLYFLRAGVDLIPEETILKAFSVVLLLTSAAFVAGFSVL